MNKPAISSPTPSSISSVTPSADSIYAREPIAIVDGIPIFSTTDAYIDNYTQIATDHVRQINEQHDNPWITNENWDDLEEGTLELALRHTQSFNQKEVKVLDVGVGLGRLLKKIEAGLAEKGIKSELHGIDIALPYLKITKAKGLDVALSRIEDMPYAEGSFDVITCTDVLEHVLDLNYCVSKILGVLKPGGVLIVRVPNQEDLQPYLEPNYPYFMVHLRNFDKSSLALLFTRIFKLKVLEYKYGLWLASASLLKYQLPVKGYRFVLFKGVRLTKAISAPLYNRLLKKLFYPVVVNVVVQKER